MNAKCKRAFLVLGPESSGTHLLTRLLIQAGCQGSTGGHAPWQIEKRELDDADEKPWESELPTDTQRWDRTPPTDQDPIVWRRSVPHGGNLPEITAMIDGLQQNNYAVHAVVVVRDQYAMSQSQWKWRHISDPDQADAQIQLALTHIFKQLTLAETEFTITTYEALVHYPGARQRLLAKLGLNSEAQDVQVIDGNRKWYQTGNDNQAASFNERRFPCQLEYTSEYYRRISIGRERMRDTSVLICGLARNIAPHLPMVSAFWETLGKCFKDYRILIFENSSTDSTTELLDEWAATNQFVKIISENLDRPAWRTDQDPVRMRYLAECRNQYLQYATEHFNDFDLYLVADTDMPRGFSIEGISNSIGHDEWDVIGSNGLLIYPEQGRAGGRVEYYDTWAFRHREESVNNHDRAGEEELSFARGEPLLPVRSCFGGLALYKRGAFLSGARYEGDECEHIAFHQQMKENGFDKIFLNPSQIVLYG